MVNGSNGERSVVEGPGCVPAGPCTLSGSERGPAAGKPCVSDGLPTQSVNDAPGQL